MYAFSMKLSQASSVARLRATAGQLVSDDQIFGRVRVVLAGGLVAGLGHDVAEVFDLGVAGRVARLHDRAVSAGAAKLALDMFYSSGEPPIRLR